MFCQFDNSYTSIQLDDDLQFVFEEVIFWFEFGSHLLKTTLDFIKLQFLGFLFMSIGSESVEYQQRYVGVGISFIKHLCGPDIYL